ncbi:phosphatidylinositol mannoside acyltransferase [Nocardia cyriacigeorgica]|uniref:Phosphatidylinositol mannoside acyltransferase n=1 Tax=Nocardia cyriacigeorgica TaxID=135487 RepID=A0A6P1DGM3_9NOCA|nr:phosphatidylinositol mannoside acyltransferase [Nocardia cyriacigeorgica]NEW42269.1 phosphatidylinositol mannoside acyltransferase [Nocardia cyriacigeorgica]NEW48324.1 phosphatidylinositol mannoside acyltransferase [Nocardia cyriacigeorgica]NEW59543.1 phosphatidylinositol mannoside acyltransferase [Nocardia cyriacigeorgica]
MNLRTTAVDLGYAAGWRLVRALPQRWATGLFDRAADRAARNGGPDQLRRNLARVIGTTPEQVPDDLIRASLRSYSRYWCEAFRLPSMDPIQVADIIESSATGLEHVRAAIDSGTGAVLALPHSGNWDLAGVWVVERVGTPTVVAERLKPESLFRRFVRFREHLGFEIIPLTGGATPPFEQLTERIRQGRVVCLLGERDLSGTGVPVTFFGEPAQMPAGPARLAIDTGAPLLPVHCWFTSDGWGFSVGTPIDTSGGVRESTQALADSFAAGISAHPADWHMLQPLWTADHRAREHARREQSR